MYDREAREKLAEEAIIEAAESMPHFYLGHDVTPWCCEIVLGALQPLIPLKIGRLEEVTFGLGAGFSLQGEVCGAVTAHIIAIGLDVVSRVRETARVRFEIAEETRRFCARFREKYGSIRCKELIGYNLNDPTEMQAFLDDKEAFARCDDMIRFGIIDRLPSESETFERDILGL